MRTSNIIPLPTEEARARLSFEQVRFHVAVLDRELQRLARGNFRSPGEWAWQTATPIVRTDCIKGYLNAASQVRHAASISEHRRQNHVDDARDQLRAALSDTASSLARLSDPAAGREERREVLQELPLHRRRQQRILGRLHELIEEVPGSDQAHERGDLTSAAPGAPDLP